MLTRIIVSAFATLVEIGLWVVLIACSLIGWTLGKMWIGSGILGASIGLVLGFVASVLVFGAFLILEDIRKSVNSIDKKKD